MAVFRGIPYASPPVGDLRWRPPQPHGPWMVAADENGRIPRDAKHYRAACIPRFRSPDVNVSEDCLFLNIAVAVEALEKKRRRHRLPVMVYIHGGAYASGASNNNHPESLVLKSKGRVIIVTLNYRLNVFGFLGGALLRSRDLEGSIGNYGIQDQRLALRWVSDHIESFGGDPAQVTIFGESAGGNSVLNHLVQRSSFGLYSRAVVESGGYVGALPLDQADARLAHLLNVTDCDDVDCLVSVSSDKLVNALNNLTSAQWSPVIDGVALSNFPQALISAGKYNHLVPLLLGSNRDEASLFMTPPSFLPNLTEARFNAFFKTSVYGKDIDDVKNLFDPSIYGYPKDLGNFSRWYWELMRVASDGGFNNVTGQPAMGLGHCSVRCLARSFLRGGTPHVYTYLFSHPSQEILLDVNEGLPLFGTGSGSPLVPHASELEYVFGMVDQLSRTNGEVALSNAMSAYWVHFAQHGNPNRHDLPKWPHYNRFDDVTLVLDVGSGSIRPTKLYHSAQCDFFDKQANSVCQVSATAAIIV